MYNSFVLPVMEYANVIWGGTYESDMLKLERIHTDGMRLVTEATARSNIANLYSDTCWNSIHGRCNNAMLVMMYKILKKTAPEYLADLLPPENNELIGYDLRNSQNIVIPKVKLETFRRSFFPLAINLWNKLPENTRQVTTIDDYKTELKKGNKEPNILYYYGKRWPSVHHARIRIGCSKLNYDLCYNLHVINEPNCTCGAIEDAYHYFIECPNYIDFCIDWFCAILSFTDVELDVLLQGDPNLNVEQNKAIFDAVYLYFERTRRFSQ
jgi:hypothetical protein